MKYFTFTFSVLFLLCLFSCNNDDNDDFEDIVDDFPIAEFLPKLSELNLFEGTLSNLQPKENVEIYRLQTPLFTDYAQKLRFISIPDGESMLYDGEGLPIFPNNTILAKTFYYYNDNRDPSLGKTVIETRTLIKKNGVWTVGNYVWTADQEDALLDDTSHDLTINWIDDFGDPKTVDYVVPNYLNCITCHQNNGVRKPIGPKIRNLNYDHEGVNQLQKFIDKGMITGAPDVSIIEKLPIWDNENGYTLDERARAFLDVNCAHCHQSGGYYDLNFDANFEFRYETPFDDTHIYDKRYSILTRMSSNLDGYSMPFIGTSLINAEAVTLMEEYVEALE